jgi:5-methylcytosine-specific restriction endonuclease McrA
MLRRKMLLKCERCGYDKEPQILGVHHKDRNRNNNGLSNLEVLCPMCHSLEHRKHLPHGFVE